MTIKQTGGGTFDANDKFLYFLASGISRLRITRKCHNQILIAVNAMGGKQYRGFLDECAAGGTQVYIDSGIFDLAQSYAKERGFTFYDGLHVPPEEIDGFEDLFDLYVQIIKEYEDHIWGYVELDQGGRESKIRIRARLEKLGLRPIPVYHPLMDGPEYFSELCSEYDRVCFANVSQTAPSDRARFLVWLGRKREQFPNTWIHLLGFSPNAQLNAFPAESIDASSWMQGFKWGNNMTYGDSVKFGELPVEYVYARGGEPDAEGVKPNERGTMLSSYIASHLARNWRNRTLDINSVLRGA